VKGFRGIYYDEKAGSLSELVAPPYDVLSEDEARLFREKSPYNVVRISVSRKSDPGFYFEALDLFENWLRDGILRRTDRAGIYYYETEFDYILGASLRRARRKGLFALLGLADYSSGEVFRHERTLRSPKVDQLNLLMTTRANLSPIFCLYSDPGMDLINELSQTKPEKPVFDFEFGGFQHRMFGIYDPKIIEKVGAEFFKKKIFIADGHHRYETALDYYHRLCFSNDPLKEAGGYVMTFLCPAEDPGLVVLPYHRLVRNLPDERLKNFIEKLKEDFIITKLANKFGMDNAKGVFNQLEKASGGQFLVLVDKEFQAFMLELKQEREEEMKELVDVEVLENLILKKVFRITKEELTENKFVTYFADEQKLLDKMHSEEFQVVFFMKAIPVNKILEIAEKGGVMPEKATYFYPKLPTGMIFRRIEPTEDFS